MSVYWRMLRRRGHKTVSEYVRSSVLGFDLVTEERIQRLFEALVEKKD